MMNHETGRAHLVAWERSRPSSFFTSDANLQAVLRQHLGLGYTAALSRLEALGEKSAQVIDPAARQEDRLPNHPRLERYSSVGERLEAIEFHPNHDLIGRIVWSSGIMQLQGEPGNTVLQMGLYYLLCLNGEAGHLCSLACTSGLIRALQQVADDTLKARYLPPLLNPDYAAMEHGAQFLTEVQGGSDVGANSISAHDAGDGTWRINGEKWFCSNVNADQFLMTARASAAPGTRGLGLFLVPRRLPDGALNGFFIRRLKDKLGTRTLASAELDFRDAVAYPVGPIEHGFKTVVELVLNTSRLMNAVACAGIMRRAYIEASQYACNRQAFGSVLAAYPLVQEAVADLHSEACAATASSFYLAHLLDALETQRAAADDALVYRLLVNANKYITSVRGSEMVHRAIEVLGGNGAIESFSVLPRLYRDMVVLESWEGTHNVLALQVLRDMQRYGVHQPFIRRLRDLLAAAQLPALAELTHHTAQAVEALEAMIGRVLRGDEAYQQAHARRLADRCGVVAQAVLLLWECAHDTLDGLKVDLLTHFIGRHIHPHDPLDDDGYLPRLERIMASA
jgi:hypothetical protein